MRLRILFVLAATWLLALSVSPAQNRIVWSSQEKPILEQIRTLRSLPNDVRANTTRQLALEIRQLPSGANQLTLAFALASRATEGDFGHDTLRPASDGIYRARGTRPLRAHAGVFGFT